MAKLIIGTQHKENYNTTGEGEPYWKFKGGSEYIVSIPQGMSEQECLNEVTPLIEYKNEMSEEFVLGHFVTGNSYQSEFEKNQLEYEGYPGYSEPRLSKVNGVWKHGSVNIGLADEQAIVWLKENADIYALLRRQLRTGKPAVAVEEVPVVEEVAVEEAPQPQTISTSTINQLENEKPKPRGWFGGRNPKQ